MRNTVWAIDERVFFYFLFFVPNFHNALPLKNVEEDINRSRVLLQRLARSQGHVNSLCVFRVIDSLCLYRMDVFERTRISNFCYFHVASNPLLLKHYSL